MSSPSKTDPRLMELETLNQISKVIHSTLDLNHILEFIATLICDKMSVDVCSIYIVEHRKLVLKAVHGVPPERITRHVKAMNEGITGQVAKSGKPLALTRAEIEARAQPTELVAEMNVASLLSVPLISRGSVIGIIDVQTRTERLFAEREIHSLKSIAGHVAAAVRNAQLYQKTCDTLAEISNLYEINKILSSTLDFRRLLDRICEAITQVLGADAALVRMQEPDVDSLILQARYERSPGLLSEKFLQVEEEIARTVLRERQSRVVSSPDKSDPRTDRSTSPFQLLCTPLLGRNLFNGTLSVCILGDEVGEEGPRFSVDSRRFLSAVGSEAAIAIGNALLFESIETAQSELQQTQRTLFRHEKLAALGEMAAGVAHEIRNPLVTIGGFARRIQKNPDEPAKVTSSAAMIVREVERLERLLKNILHFVSPRKYKFRPVDLRELVKHCQQMLMEELRNRSIQFRRSIPGHCRWVEGEREFLCRAFLNLFSNAIDAMPEGGELKVSLLPCPRSPTHVEVHVSNTGYPIPKEIIHDIFNPFFTTKATGTGLGLPITKSIIEGHFGTIKAELPDKGETCFIFTLRRSGQSADDSSQEDA